MDITETEQGAVAPDTSLSLLERVKTGDEEAFNELYSTYRRRVVSAVRHYISEPDVVEHITNGVFMRLWQVRNSTSGFQGNSAFLTWLTKVAYNAALMHIRSTKNERINGCSLDAPLPRTDDDTTWGTRFAVHDTYLEGIFDRKELDRAFAKLPADYRKVVIMRLVDGMSNEEVCEALGLKMAVVKSRLFRGRQMVRKALERNSKKVSKLVEEPVY